MSSRFVGMLTPPGRLLGCLLGPLLVAVAVAALLGSGSAAPAAAAPEPGTLGIGDRYFPLDGNGGIDVVHYRISDRYEFDSGRLSGRTRLTVRATQDLTRFHLDFLLPVRWIRLDGSSVRWARESRHELTVDPRGSIDRGERFTVVVSYSGRPDRLGYLGEHNWLADRHEVVAMNQPHMAPWWFPSNDHPRDKALMDISITVPRGKTVVANGHRVGRERDGRLVTHHWRADEPMTTYLAMFAAGPFEVETSRVDGLPVRLLVSRRLPDPWFGASRAMLRRTPALLRQLQDDLGDYPFSTAGGLVTSLPVGFALENQTLPTYFGVPGGDWDWLVVHEQAHQWFGDSVAIERWRDIWLNEGAATFMEVRHEEQQGDETGEQWLEREWQSRGAANPFWDLEIADPGADRIFATPVYVRGAMTFQALRNRIGEDDFWALLQQWVSDNAGGNATTGDFEAMAEHVSGDDLDGFFDAWIHSRARPAHTADNGLVVE